MTRSEALEASIKHWEENCAAKYVWEFKLGPGECALCRLYWDDGCIGCPVMENTGLSCCEGTPFVNVATEIRSFLDKNAPWASVIEACTSELEFLKGLRNG